MDNRKDDKAMDDQSAQEQIVNNERRFESIFNHVSDLQVLWKVYPDGQFKIEKINDTYLNAIKAVGVILKREDVIGLTMDEMKELLHGDPEIHEKTRQRYLNAMNLGQKVVYTEKIPIGDSVYVSENTITPIKNIHGEIDYLLYNSHDLTKLAMTEQELRTSKERFELAMMASQDGLFDWKVLQKELYLSPGWKHMIGYDDEDLGNSPSIMESLVSPEDYQRIITIQKDLLSKKINRFEMEYKMKHKKGHWVEILSRGQAILDDKGEVERIIGTHADISARKKLERHLNQSQKLESIGRLAGGIAHDFNNMLSIIIGLSEVTLSKLDSKDEMYSDIEEIYSAGLKSAALTNQLLAFSRKQVSSPKVINLNETIQDLLKMLRRLISEDISLEFQTRDNLWDIKIDPTQVDQILTNLCINARDSINKKGIIQIEVENVSIDRDLADRFQFSKPGDFIMISVTDNGTGMDEETKERIFEPFYTTKDLGRGTGLGLATVYGIIKQNEGWIHVYSEKNHGSVFKVYLPRYKQNEDGSKEERQYTLPKGNGNRILLVEDEKSLLRMTKIMLESLGYEVIGTTKAKEALKILEKQKDRIQLLLTDVIMPEINGEKLAEMMLAIHPNLKLLFMSGYSNNIFSKRKQIGGTIHLISKPFSQQQLAEKIFQILNSP